jgi:hypothetical protein
MRLLRSIVLGFPVALGVGLVFAAASISATAEAHSLCRSADAGLGAVDPIGRACFALRRPAMQSFIPAPAFPDSGSRFTTGSLGPFTTGPIGPFTTDQFATAPTRVPDAAIGRFVVQSPRFGHRR